MTEDRLRTSLVLVAAWLALAAPVYAQSFGVRGGVSADPRQFFLGAHVESPGLTSTGHLTFRPNVEIGFGNNVTIVSGNLEFVYWVKFPQSDWSGYFGAGPAVNIVKADFQDTAAHGGFNGLVGFQHSNGIFLELKAGGGNGPSLKATVGYVLKMK
jgi:hypothetical protein